MKFTFFLLKKKKPRLDYKEYEEEESEQEDDYEKIDELLE